MSGEDADDDRAKNDHGNGDDDDIPRRRHRRVPPSSTSSHAPSPAHSQFPPASRLRGREGKWGAERPKASTTLVDDSMPTVNEVGGAEMDELVKKCGKRVGRLAAIVE